MFFFYQVFCRYRYGVCDRLPSALCHNGINSNWNIGGKKEGESKDGKDLFPGSGTDSLPFMDKCICAQCTDAAITKCQDDPQ